MSSKIARWYVVQSYSGAESKVAQTIQENAIKHEMGDKVEEVYIPAETIVELKNGVKVDKVKNYFPGYVFIKMVIDDDLLYLIRNVPRVSGFVGMNGNPTPITEAEMERIVNRTKESSNNPRNAIRYEVGDQVRVTDGPFASFSGNIEEIEENKQRLKVSVMIFGRSTPVTLEYSQVERI